MPETLQSLTSLFATYGYWVLFFGVMLESAGVPVPGETVLLAAAFVASPAGGSLLHLWTVVVVAAAAAIIGDNVGYWVGRKWARPRIKSGKRFLFLTPARVHRADSYFSKYGSLTVFFGRFIALLRIIAGPAAGVARMPWRRFLLANAAGAVVWATTTGLLGYFAGGAWDSLRRWLGWGAWALAALLGLGIAAWHLIPYAMRGRDEARRVS